MRRITVRDVVDATGALLVRGDAETVVDGFSTDTRALTSGQLFIALSGPNFDGNRFARAAVEAGATALLLREDDALDPLTIPGHTPVLVHPDPRRGFGDLASWHRSLTDVPVVGITGSCGKTTVKNIAAELLASQAPLVASPSSFNNDVGVPHTLLLGDETTRLYLVEMGTNDPGEIAGLARIAKPSCGIITNIGASHLAGLGSLEGVAQEKGDLGASLPREGFLVLNADCRFLPELRSRTAARVITFGSAGEGDLRASKLVFHSGGTTFRLHGGDATYEVTSPLLGTHNVQNLLAALALGRGLGLTMEELLPRVATLSGGRQRMERVELAGVTVFDDTYNANPESSRAAVRSLVGMHGFERRVLVLGDMLELGEFAAEMHHALGVEAARAGVDLLVLAGELTRATAAGALEGGMPEETVIHLDTTEEAAERVPGLVRDGDVVLVKASRGIALERVVRALQRDRGRDGGKV